MRGDAVDGIYGWIKSIVFYLILMTMIMNLIPDKKYERYLRLFAGMVLILLVFGPFSDLTGLEARLAGVFEKITFQNDVNLLKKDLTAADEDRLKRLLTGYEEMVETDLRIMAEGFQIQCLDVSAVFDDETGSEQFGNLKEVHMAAGLFSGPSEDSETNQERRLEANREISRLRKKIGEYYGLEEGKITITLENE